jgi:hypothetical protein
MLRKFGIIAVLSLMALALAAVPALAVTSTPENGTITGRTGGLHFVGTPQVFATLTSNSTFLTATGEVAGAGSTGGTADLSATAEVTRGCINRGSQGQEPSGLQRSTTLASGTTTFDTTRNGRGRFNVSTTPITIGSFTCPDQMRPTLVSVTYSNISLTVESQTGTTTATFPNITLSL